MKLLNQIGHALIIAGSTIVAVAPDIVRTVAPFFPENKYIQAAAAVVAILTGGNVVRHVMPDEKLHPALRTGTRGLAMKHDTLGTTDRLSKTTKTETGE